MRPGDDKPRGWDAGGRLGLPPARLREKQHGTESTSGPALDRRGS